MTPYLRLQLDRAWALDDRRRERFAAVRTEGDLRVLPAELRRALLATIGGRPGARGPLNARVGSWAESVRSGREEWPVQLLLPAGADLVTTP